jgi:hypothetical protein
MNTNQIILTMYSRATQKLTETTAKTAIPILEFGTAEPTGPIPVERTVKASVTLWLVKWGE